MSEQRLVVVERKGEIGWVTEQDSRQIITQAGGQRKTTMIQKVAGACAAWTAWVEEKRPKSKAKDLSKNVIMSFPLGNFNLLCWKCVDGPSDTAQLLTALSISTSNRNVWSPFCLSACYLFIYLFIYFLRFWTFFIPSRFHFSFFFFFKLYKLY